MDSICLEKGWNCKCIYINENIWLISAWMEPASCRILYMRPCLFLFFFLISFFLLSLQNQQYRLEEKDFFLIMLSVGCAIVVFDQELYLNLSYMWNGGTDIVVIIPSNFSKLPKISVRSIANYDLSIK